MEPEKEPVAPGSPSNKVVSESIGFQTTFSSSTPNLITVALQQNVSHSVLSAAEISELRTADPAAVELLYKLIDRQQLHDHSVEVLTLRSESRYRLWGILAALTVVGAQISVAALAVVHGYGIIAGIFGGAAVLTTLAGVFIRGRGLIQPPSAAERQTVPYPVQQMPTHPPPPPQ